ncbi:MAG: hypothetical protein ACOX2F_10645 [bacterium]
MKLFALAAFMLLFNTAYAVDTNYLNYSDKEAKVAGAYEPPPSPPYPEPPPPPPPPDPRKN